jgi:hypothetical protein
MKAFKNPKKNLFPNLIKRYEQVKHIFEYLSSLKYHDQPDYKFIKDKLLEIRSLASLRSTS